MTPFISWMEAATGTPEVRVRRWGSDFWEPVHRVAETIFGDMTRCAVVRLDIDDMPDGCCVQCVDHYSEPQAEFRFASREEAVSFARSLAALLEAAGPDGGGP